jgi:hypothetical protein
LNRCEVVSLKRTLFEPVPGRLLRLLEADKPVGWPQRAAGGIMPFWCSGFGRPWGFVRGTFHAPGCRGSARAHLILTSINCEMCLWAFGFHFQGSASAPVCCLGLRTLDLRADRRLPNLLPPTSSIGSSATFSALTPTRGRGSYRESRADGTASPLCLAVHDPHRYYSGRL